jgi:hypothetical protein
LSKRKIHLDHSLAKLITARTTPTISIRPTMPHMVVWVEVQPVVFAVESMVRPTGIRAPARIAAIPISVILVVRDVIVNFTT